MPLKKQWFHLAAGWLVLLLFVTMPFPYAFLPQTGEVLRPFTEGIVERAASILSLPFPYRHAITSDTSGFLLYLFLLFILSALLATSTGWVQKKKQRTWFTPGLSSGMVSAYLSLQMMIYGADKLFKYQFFFPEPNTLYTPLGMLEKDILYWSAIGASHSYNVYLGICEIIPALMLLFLRTRFAGSVLMLPVLINVVAINFCYDISVKIYSLLLLALNIYLLLPYRHQLFSWLGFRSVQGNITSPVSEISPRNRLGYALVKSVTIGLIITEAFFKYATYGVWNGDQLHAQTPLYGAYQVEYTTTTEGMPMQPLQRTGNKHPFRLFFHSRGYLVVQTMDDHFYDYPVSITPDYLLVSQTDHNWPIAKCSYRLIPGGLHITGIGDTASLDLACTRLHLDTLPLSRDGFHFLLDDHAPGADQ